jgi:hypothetical protein
MDGVDDTRSKPVKRKSRSVNSTVVSFSFFLFLSFIFWYLNSLSKVGEAEISYPVKFLNIPNERSIADEHSLKLNFYIKGPGYSIFKLKVLQKKSPVVIDISKVSCVKIPGSTGPDYFILTSGLTRNLAAQLRSECEITAIKPDTLFFSLNNISSISGSRESDNAMVRGEKN